MMSRTRKRIGERDAVVEENNSSFDDNDDTSESAEIYEPVRQLDDVKESRNPLERPSDADVSNSSSSDSTQNDTKETTQSAAGCSSKQDPILKIVSKRTQAQFYKQVDCSSSTNESFTTSGQDNDSSSASNTSENSSEVASKKEISKTYLEKFTNNRWGCSDIAANVIEDDAIDHSDDTVSVGSSVQSSSQTLDFQEVISGEVFSATVSTAFSHVSQIEGENVSYIITEPLNPQYMGIEETVSSNDPNPSDDKMVIRSASPIPSGIGSNTDIENMECSSASSIPSDFEYNTDEIMEYSSGSYSGFESIKIDGRTNATLVKMDCKSGSSASCDKMEIDVHSLKSNETDGMECSSDSISGFEQKSISIHENESTNVQSESTSVQENDSLSCQSIIVEENDSSSVQEKESMNVHGKKSVVDQESEYIGVQENRSITFQVNKLIDVPESKVISVQENESISAQENKSISVQENESISVQENELISVQENESTVIQENESINYQQTASIRCKDNTSGNILQQEDASPQLLESGNFVSRTIQENVSQHLQETPRGLINDATTSQVLPDIKYTTFNESGSSSNEIKSINASTTDPNTGIGERKFTIPRQEASDTKEYDYEQKQVSKENVDENLLSCSKTSVKRRNSTEDEELKDNEDKMSHKKFKK